MGALSSAARPAGGGWDAFRLPASAVEAYHRDGFVTIPAVVPEAECDALLDDVAALLDPAGHPARGLFYELHFNQTGDSDAVLAHALGAWRISKLFHDLVFHPAIAAAASQLMGDVGVRFWHDQLFCKPPRAGGGVAWHQDYSYWTRTRPMNHMTVHIALDAQDVENGCIQYIPGSHRWTRDGGKPLPITADDFADMDSIKSILSPEEAAAFTPQPAVLGRGSVSFHHPLAVHGSFKNTSDRPRRAAVVNYFADGTVSAAAPDDDELLAGVRVPAGQAMQGQFFPVVFDPSWR